MKVMNPMAAALALSILPLISFSESLTPDQALQRLASSKHNRVAALASASLTLAASPEMLYVFSSEDGEYVIASADDCGPAMLGFGADFDADNVPAAMAELFERYAREIEWLSQNPQKATALANDYATVDPLVTTKWNQSSPYNDLCPMDGASRSVTGCVATAMAQVVNYHKWPASTGQGTHSYTWNGSTLAFDYSSTAFDWANMSDSYGASSTQKSKTAVATLMKACGYGVNMEYSSKESGAPSHRIPAALVDNFGYDKGAAYLMREYFSTSEWNDLIHAELEAGRPVLYAGSNSGGGHQFVCDGYRGNGYFHINWGWGGTSDGYFLLSALDPYSQGIGGSSSGYNNGQDMVIGVRPPVADSEVFLPFYSNGYFEWDTYYNGFCFGKNPNGGYYGYFNYSPNAFSYQAAIKLEDEAGNAYYSYPSTETLAGCNEDGSVNGSVLIRPIYPDFPAGQYKASPVARLVGDKRWQPIRIPASEVQYALVRKGQNGAITYDGSDPELTHLPLNISNIQQLSDWFTGQEARFSLQVKNSSSTAETVKTDFLFKDAASDQVYTMGTWTIEYAANESRTRTFRTSSLNIPEGEYIVRAIDKSCMAYISDSYRIFVGVRPTLIQIQQSAANIEVGESTTLSAAVLPADTPFKTVRWTSSDESIATVDAQGNVTGVGQGTAQITAISQNDLEATLAVNVAASSGIEDVTLDHNSPVDVYSINGLKLQENVAIQESTTGLAPGVYILRQNGRAVKILIQ
ncbi:MAG: C10 family peptidase [Clostridium sp.]|nr:C10 family peptidase [Clostridium sp.]